MYVAQIMSSEVDTATEDMKLSRTAQIMRDSNRRFLPVVDSNNCPVGMFSHEVLAKSEPSATTTLSVGKVNYLTAKVTIGQLMQKKPLSCGPGALVEEAGHLMRHNKNWLPPGNTRQSPSGRGHGG